VEEAAQTSHGDFGLLLLTLRASLLLSVCTFFLFKVPYQRNGWDCGVFMCRYAYGLYLLRHEPFSFGQTNLRSSKRKDRFKLFLTESDAFKFNGDDIQRIRTEIKTLIENLSVVYAKVKEAEKQAKERARKAAATLASQSNKYAAGETSSSDNV
jgi:hypothetical protein